MIEALRFAGGNARRTLINGLCVFQALFALIMIAPVAETNLLPVLTEIKSAPVVRTTEKACWAVGFYKARLLRVHSVVWQAVEADGTHRVLYAWDRDGPADRLQHVIFYPIGPVSRELCAAIPPELRDRPFQIQGRLTYLPDHGFYPLSYEVPEVDF